MLTYHMANGEYRSTDLKNMNSLISLETGELALSTTAGRQVMVGNATVIEPDILLGMGLSTELTEYLSHQESENRNQG